MKLKKIVSKRDSIIYNPKVYVGTQILYEWENIIATELQLDIALDNLKKSKVPFLKFLSGSQDNSLLIEMAPHIYQSGFNRGNIVPYIVDFFVERNYRLKAFYCFYYFNKAVIISSREVYEMLINQGCPLKIFHLALSLPDQYAITSETKFNKKYDLIMMGRHSPVLVEYAMRYAKRHPEFTYVYQKQEGGQRCNYDQNDNKLCTVNTRQEYMDFMKTSRVALYSTPSMDGGEKRAKGYNQVTPKFLEYLACGCHVIARYPKNPDTDYYNLDNIVLRNVNDYDEFERAMDYARIHDVDYNKYSKYLKKHYTTARIPELKNILESI